MLQVPLFVPPVPDIPERPLKPLGFLHAVRTNAIRIWPRSAYDVEVLEQRFLPQPTTLLNAPEAIRHVLVDNSVNYRRSRASVRILWPLVGDGLLLSEGEDWRLQRRTIAPALAPRVLPILCRHVEQCAAEMVARLGASIEQPVELLTEMQAVALEIAGRSMFSLEMAQFRIRLRGELMHYAKHHAHPRLLDMILPPHIPSPRDLGRRRFHRRWMRLVDEVMQARMAAEHSGEERDLFDLLRAARDPETGSGFSHEQLRDQIATLMIAGHETTAVTLFWALYLLAHAPAYQERIAAEAGRPLAEMPVTRAVVNETLRLYPPAFTLARQALAPDQVDGLHIPAGMVTADLALGAAPAPQAVARAGQFRPGALHAGCAAAAALRFPAVRRRAADLRRRTVRLGRGGNRAGPAGRRVPDLVARHAAGYTDRHHHHAAKPPAALRPVAALNYFVP